MRPPRTSIWLPALMTVYAAAFFAYEFIVRGVGLSPRNVAAVAAAAMAIAAVWWANRRSERRKAGGGTEDKPTNDKYKAK